MPGPTTLALSIDAASGVTVQSLTLHVDLGGDDAGVSEALPPSGAMPVLPGRAVVRLPDVAMDVAVALDGQDADGNALHADTVGRTVPHHEVSASLTLGGSVVVGDDLGMNGPDDLAMPVDAGLPCVAGERCNHLYRRQLTIHNGASAALPAGYTVRVPLDTATTPTTPTTRSSFATGRSPATCRSTGSARARSPRPSRPSPSAPRRFRSAPAHGAQRAQLPGASSAMKPAARAAQ